MLSWLCKTRVKKRNSAQNRVRPFLEGLEDRYCPSGLQITQFTATIVQGHTVNLTGTISDSNPASVSLSFSGVASGSVTANSNGQFQLQTQASSLGTVTALGTDGDKVTSSAQTTVSAPAPTFSNLAATQSGPNKQITVTGTVSSGANLTVTLSGIVSGSVTTGTNGTFSFKGTASNTGQVNLSVTDTWGQTGTGAVQLTNNAPTITNFTATNNGYGIWTFQGKVNDEWAPGLTVTFSGLTPLQGATVTVGNDGWFSYSVQLGPTDTGLVVASVTDWYGASGRSQVLVS
jgi:hypothetical protein